MAHLTNLLLLLFSNSGLDLALLPIVSDDSPPMQLEILHLVIELVVILLLSLLLHCEQFSLLE